MQPLQEIRAGEEAEEAARQGGVDIGRQSDVQLQLGVIPIYGGAEQLNRAGAAAGIERKVFLIQRRCRQVIEKQKQHIRSLELLVSQL